MPELPEVETLKCFLESKIIGLTINKLNKNRNTIRYKLSEQLGLHVESAKIIALRRRAKYLLIDLDNSYSIIVHLGMTGRFTIQPRDYKIQKHDHIVIFLGNGKLLVFNDSRRFGMIYSIKTNLIESNFLKNLGVEPLSDHMSVDYLETKLKNCTMPIKNLLMNNKIIVGIGNIYASESLFIAKIHPNRPSNSLTSNEIHDLLLAIKHVLAKAILAGGTTLKDFVSGDSKPGYFKQELQVYARENQKCLNCQSVIEKIKQAGRTTFYCPTCQI